MCLLFSRRCYDASYVGRNLLDKRRILHTFPAEGKNGKENFTIADSRIDGKQLQEHHRKFILEKATLNSIPDSCPITF